MSANVVIERVGVDQGNSFEESTRLHKLIGEVPYRGLQERLSSYDKAGRKNPNDFWDVELRAGGCLGRIDIFAGACRCHTSY